MLIWTGVPVPLTVFFFVALGPFSACSAFAILAFSASILFGLFMKTCTTAYWTREAKPKRRHVISHTSIAFTYDTFGSSWARVVHSDAKLRTENIPREIKGDTI